MLPAMITKFPSPCLCAVVVLVATAAASLPLGAGAAAGCIDDWAEASAIVKQRDLVPLADLSRVAPERFNGRIVTARLCQRDGNYYYRLVIRDEDGRVRQLEADPVSGRQRSASAKD